MPEQTYPAIKKLLTSNQPEGLYQGLELVRQELAGGVLETEQLRPLFELLSTIFYIDPLDRPELVPILDQAVGLVKGFGTWVIPILIKNLDAGDIKAQLAVAHALGRIGAAAIEPLLQEYQATADPAQQTFILYALGKIESPQLIQAVPIALKAAGADDLELRDTATRVLGKLAAAIPPAQLTPEMHHAFLDRLHQNLADPNPGIRAKALRSLGKLAKYQHLNPAEQQELQATCQSILGMGEQYQWDHAYIVRKEAEEALQYV